MEALASFAQLNGKLVTLITTLLVIGTGLAILTGLSGCGDLPTCAQTGADGEHQRLGAYG